ncbi:hypothetical protein J2Z31_003803 [Sinorhizobium kostiense]|uniref:Uncharacterized protein n=1 Tax=Sinorhizobium kostiense TaxID=76747 RepID=A0ABS4R4N9_9HYPH|nr:hypothetical protein [Sinorhizobium kostiense]
MLHLHETEKAAPVGGPTMRDICCSDGVRIVPDAQRSL